jgi:hypothetical protein
MRGVEARFEVEFLEDDLAQVFVRHRSISNRKARGCAPHV